MGSNKERTYVRMQKRAQHWTQRGQRPQSGSSQRQDGSILARKFVVRAEGIEPSRPCGLRIFVPLRLSPPRQRRVRGLDYPFTLPRTRFRCCPSSLYTFPDCIRAWLGIAIAGSPDFEQFYTAGFPMGTQSLKSAASAISPRPRGIWPQQSTF